MSSRGVDQRQMQREARVAGIRRYGTPSLQEVEARRSQLGIVGLVVLAGLAAGIALLSAAEPRLDGPDGIVSTDAARWGLVGSAVAFALYALEKEVHLRRLSRMLMDERVLSTALSNQVGELSKLAEATRAVNTVLDLDATVGVILANALDFLGADSGTVLLAGADGDLEVLCGRGGEGPPVGSHVRLGEGAAGAAARTRQALLVARDDEHETTAVTGRVMAAPLLHRDEVVGVLVVRRGPDGLFADYDLRVLSLFAEATASAIAHARAYALERRHVTELIELNELKSAFVAMVSHEFKSPLSSVIGAARTLQRHDLPEEHVAPFLDMIERQAQRLADMVTDVLDLKRAEQPASVAMQTVDVGSVARSVARLSQAAGRPVELRVAEGLFALADPAALEQVLLNLIDNAFTHGWGTVEVEGARDGEHVVVSVLDRGSGVAPEDTERIFDPFERGAAPEGGGSGLGLYLVRTLTEAQGGSVSVVPRPGGGAQFTVRLTAVNPVDRHDSDSEVVPSPVGAP